MNLNKKALAVPKEVPGEEIRLLEIVQISLSAVILKKAKMFKKNAERILKSSEIKRN